MLHGDELWFMFIETKINIINHAMPLSNHRRWHVYHSTKRAGSWHCWTPTFMDLADLASKFASKSCQKWEDHGGLEATHTIADLFRVRLLAYWMVKMVKGLILFLRLILRGFHGSSLDFPRFPNKISWILMQWKISCFTPWFLTNGGFFGPCLRTPEGIPLETGSVELCCPTWGLDWLTIYPSCLP